MAETPAGTLDGRLSAEQVRQELVAAGVKKEGGQAGDDETSALKEWVELLVRAGFWALLIYLFIFQVSVVNGPSMEPNFADADKLVIDKLTFRFSPVRRFDVIVFEAVDHEKLPRRSQDYIKRVIGLPGEKVTLRGGRKVSIDGRAIKEPYRRKFNRNGEPDDTEDAGADSGYATTFVVPEGHYFVMGDHRVISHDSRSAGLGYVPEGQIKGLVRVRWWPWKKWDWFSRQ